MNCCSDRHSQRHLEENPGDTVTYWEKLNDNRLGKPKEEKERKKDNEVATPKVISIKVIAGLDIIFSRDHATPRLCAE
jgi:hypothetical protein